LWEHDIGVFSADFEQQGDEWAHHVAVELTGHGHMNARGTDGTGPVELGPPLSGPLTSTLRVRPHENGIACTVVGNSDTASPDQVDPWRRAAETAVAAMGHRDQVFVWQAIVSTSPDTLGLDDLGRLRAPYTLGPAHVEPGDVCMREHIVLDDRVDQAVGIRHSFPIIATGAVSTYAWEQVHPIAQWCLGRACALLSLATGRLWVPRSQPRHLVDGQEGLRVPAVVGLPIELPGMPEEPEWRGQIPTDSAQFELPDWISRAWPILKADPGLATAVHAHYEAMRLHHRHPSVAHLTYVAAIEGFGKRFAADAPCDCRPGCTHLKGVAQKRFRKALRTVLSKREVEQLAALAYAVRSSTGHEGSLFGGEDTYGHSPMSLFRPAADLVLDMGLLGELRHVSRRVLTAALADAPRPDQHSGQDERAVADSTETDDR
jgi:hypothetical protein